MSIHENEKMDDDNDEQFDKGDLKKKKDKKRLHKQTKEKEECAKESFKKMKEEIDEMRKREADRAKELEELKKKIEIQEKTKMTRAAEPEYVLGFSKDVYLNKGFIESAKWIKDEMAKKLTEKMMSEENKPRFEALILAKKNSIYLGARACARYNRGEECHQGKWHTTQKHEIRDRLGPRPSRDYFYEETRNTRQPGCLESEDFRQHDSRQHVQDLSSRKAELRLHACTLCLETFGAAFGHNVLNCPWIQKKNWNE